MVIAKSKFMCYTSYCVIGLARDVIKLVKTHRHAYVYVLKVCTVFMNKKYFWVCSGRVDKLWDIQLCNYAINGLLCCLVTCKCHCLSCPVNHLVTDNILHISFHLIWNHIRKKCISTLICQSLVFHAENSVFAEWCI